MFDTSDHLPNFTMTKKKIKLNKDDNHRMIRDLSNTNINNLKTCMNDFNWKDSIQFNSIHLFSVIKKQQNTLKVRTCTQQDGGGTTKSKSLKMLYPLYKQIVQYKHEGKKNTNNTNKYKQAKI